MTQKKYLEARGDACPNCTLDLIQVQDSTRRNRELRETLECTACLTRFERVYKLHAYKLL